jgi:N-acetylneuraminate 9-O-acetyltransferase
MIIRINYFPLMLSFFLTVPLELYYVVPLHTTGFVVTMITCWIGYKFEKACGMGYWKSRTLAVALSLLVHIIFYETPAVNFRMVGYGVWIVVGKSGRIHAMGTWI